MRLLWPKKAKSLGTRFHGDDGKSLNLVIPACSKRESSAFFFSKAVKALGTRFHGYDGLILLIFLVSTSAQAFPVIDVANLHQNIIQVKHMLEEINTLKQQVQTAKSQLNSINGVRGMANSIDSVYDISVKVDPNLTLNKQGIHNSDWLKLGGDAAGLFDDINRYRGQWFGQTQISLQQTQQRYQQLMRLIERINQAPQQKDIQDLQARINAEGVMLENEQAKLQLLNAQAQASDALTQQKITQMAIESAGELKPINW